MSAGTGIAFEEYGGLNQHEAQRMARDPEVKPLYLRVMFAGIGWSNLIGHAEFATGGLAMILQSSDPRTAEMSMPNRNQINTAIKRGKEMGLLEEGSTFKCLIMPAELWHKAGGRGGRTCAHHGIGTKRQRHTRSVTPSSKRPQRSVAATHEECHGEPLTSANATPLYDSILTTPERHAS